MKLTVREGRMAHGAWAMRTHALIHSKDQLSRMRPAFVRCLSQEMAVTSLSGRVCPVSFDDGTAGVFVLADYCQDDQTLALLDLLVSKGFRLNDPSLFVLAPALMVAIDRSHMVGALSGVRQATGASAQYTALSDAFNDLVSWGLQHGASDIHLNVRRVKPESSVFFTISGRYICPERYQSIPTATLLEMLAVAWMGVQGGNGAVFDPMVEQQGRLNLSLEGREVLLRWASLATDAGPSVCLRLLVMDCHTLTPDLKTLGYVESQIRALQRSRAQEGGAVVLAGVVGSGKSTTIATLMREISLDRKVITLEDPAEYLIPNALQNTICRTLDETDGASFDTKLKTIKRSAMNDLLIGEVRDAAGGRAFMDLAGCGVNLYTTVHAGSALLISERLASSFIGVARDLLATPGILKLLVYQCLIARLCQHCALSPHESLASGPWRCFQGVVRETQWFGQWLSVIEAQTGVPSSALRFRNQSGCKHCQHASVSTLNGTVGRTVVAEMIEPEREPDFLAGIQRHDNLGLHHWFHARARRALTDPDMDGKTAMQVAIYKMSQGQIDPRQIEGRFGAFEWSGA